MSESMQWTRCFLCRRKSGHSKETRFIESTICPASKKTLKHVILFLARQARVELNIAAGEWICLSCHSQIVDYDTCFLGVIRKQQKLAQLIEKSLMYVESDLEEESEYYVDVLNEFNNEVVLNDIMVPEDEMQRVVEEEEALRRTGKAPLQTGSFESTLERGGVGIAEGQAALRISQCKEKCSICSMRFKSKQRLQAHISRAHKKYCCKLCDFSHRNEDYVLLHMNVHEGRTEHQCRFCDKEFTTKISTIRHMESHFDSKKYQCDKCGLCFSQTTVLYNHKLQHEAEEQPLRCDICQQTFKTKRTYRHHMITHQADRPRYSCEYCSKTFTEKYTLKVHTRMHTDVKEECFENGSIVEEYVATQNDTDPSDMHHMDEDVDEQFVIQSNEIELTGQQTVGVASRRGDQARSHCVICDRTFVSKDQLDKHMQNEHDVILNTLALSTYSTFEDAADATRPCHLCGNVFNSKMDLYSHMYEVHGVSL